MKWGVGRVIYEAIMHDEGADASCTYENGVNNGRLVVLPYYHLNMEKIMPENEDLSLVSMWPGKNAEVYCIVRLRDGDEA